MLSLRSSGLARTGSFMRGIIFFGILLTASLLLSPTGFFPLLPREWKLWIVRRWTDKLWTRVGIVIGAVFVALCSWLTYSAPPDVREMDREHAQKLPASNILIKVAPR